MPHQAARALSTPGAILLATVFGTAPACARSYHDIYDFKSTSVTPADATNPQNLTVDSVGRLLGATVAGATSDKGAVFRLTPPAAKGAPWSEEILLDFASAPQLAIAFTAGHITVGPSGELYNNSRSQIYRLDNVGANWVPTVLHEFTGGNDGNVPSPVVFGGMEGLLYGTSQYGGRSMNGAVFSVSPLGDHTEFEARGLKSEPISPLTPAGDNRFFYTTYNGLAGPGIVYSLVEPATGRWRSAAIYTFTDTDDVQYPLGIIVGPGKILYGCAGLGGEYGYGGVFQLTPPAAAGAPWTERAIYSYLVPVTECDIAAGLHGSIVGVTYQGGAFVNSGMFFELDPPAIAGGLWTETTLHDFNLHQNGLYHPIGAPVVIGNAYYGAAAYGGISPNWGGIYEITP